VARGGALDGIDFEEVSLGGVREPGSPLQTAAVPAAWTSQLARQSLIPYGVTALVIVLLIGFWPDGYWYCANSGPAQPHHTGLVVTRNDHACNHFEVWLNGNPARPARR
jgi:hypothetical protein